MVANLLSNARKYSPDGGSIVVAARALDGSVEVTVQDHGLGIPPESLSQMFAKFYRVETPDRRTIRGTGLGLAISKNIVEAHGGKIMVRSQGLGRGRPSHSPCRRPKSWRRGATSCWSRTTPASPISSKRNCRSEA